MANGAVTLGTRTGPMWRSWRRPASGREYIFGAHVEEIRDKAGPTDPRPLYESDGRIRRVLDALVDGTLDDGGTGMFHDLFDSILKGASWHRPDQYYLLLDFGSYLDAKIQINRDLQDRLALRQKGLAQYLLLRQVLLRPGHSGSTPRISGR